MMSTILITGGRIFDPSSGRDEEADLFIIEGLIAPAPTDLPADVDVVDARDRVIVPGLIDLHVHLREPGKEAAETIESGSRAAARGGMTAVVAMPNTTPPLDSAERVAWQRQRGDEVGKTRVWPSACISAGRAGKELADLKAMADAGAVAFTDDGSTVQSDELMREAMQMAAELGVPILDHAQDRAMELAGGVMHEGEVSQRLGMPGIPSVAEVRTIKRDIILAEETGCAVHIQHVSTKEGVDLIRDAKERGLRVTGEATPHHLALADVDIDRENSSHKMNPPLRSPEDREVIRRAVAEGVLEVIATDHAPHTAESKAKGFLAAPFGIIGLETAVGVSYTELVVAGLMNFETWLQRWTLGPARVLGIEPPALQVGQPANLVVLDLDSEWLVDPDKFRSLSRNTPFVGRALVGRAVCTICQGKIVWRE